jgi:glutamate--cysteine ligase
LGLEKNILQEIPGIEYWFRKQWRDHTPPFYTSVDLRNSGFKLAPVDTNLFPAGFNNLNPDFLPLSVQAAVSGIEKICPDVRGLLLIPENHTRNMFYFQSLATLQTVLKQAGIKVRIGSLLPELKQPMPINLPSGQTLLLEPLLRKDNRLMVEGFEPCAILLNNDLSAGIPDILKNVDQPILPPLHAGWVTRRKTHHFGMYNQVAESFAKLIGIDPWVINPYFTTCGEINFHERTGEECLAANVDELLKRIKVKYNEYGIQEQPFVMVKADAGTYGMGIMSVKDASEVRDLNRKERNKMSVVKEGLEVTEVIIQEGVYTFEHVHDAIAEPVIYMMDHFVVGGFYRVHTQRGNDQNLNAPGMHFVPLEFEAPCTMPNEEGKPDCMPNRFYTYGVIARLAMLAAALELENNKSGANG